jgi:putative ABC transport system substrate-binding protein
MTKARADALTVISTPLFDTERRRLVELAAARRLPAVYTFKPYVEAGGLMSYGPDVPISAGRNLSTRSQAPSPVICLSSS